MTELTKEETIQLESMDGYQDLFGEFDQNITAIERELHVTISLRENKIKVAGPEGAVDVAAAVLTQLLKVIAAGQKPDADRMVYAIELAKKGQAQVIFDVMTDVVAMTRKGKQVRCKSAAQRLYVKAMKEKTVVFCEGPAGTGKTYLAIAMAVIALKNRLVEKIILTRPAVEAGESLGFLPGDLQEKVDPYLRPLFDALQEFLGEDKYEKLVDRGAIEVAPLAFMRGRTLKNSFVILDEAQNCTVAQMKMFLTRLGENSKIVVTGDATQTDLPDKQVSGLKNAITLLSGIEEIGVIHFTDKDVVRHHLVQRIIDAYEKDQRNG